MKRALLVAVLSLAAAIAFLARHELGEAASAGAPWTAPAPAAAAGIHKIKHVVVIMQENRSFDSYFGTYPGADGIPMRNGVPTVCVPDPAHGRLRQAVPRPRPTGTPAGRTTRSTLAADIDGGRMDGFIAQARDAPQARAAGATRTTRPAREPPPSPT